MKILILGGTAEARHLAGQLVALGHEVISSLAGRTRDPILPPGTVRIGSFGGIAGLAAYLREEQIARLVDATHPYAAAISANAVAASALAGVRLVRYLRPPWQPPPGQDWIDVASADAAARALPSGARVLLTTGHAQLDTYLGRQDCHFHVRVIEAPDIVLPAHADLIQARPPYDLAAERTLMQAHRITHLISKNSGGGQIAAKVEAARQLNVQVIMIARPAYDPAIEVDSIAEALAVLDADVP